MQLMYTGQNYKIYANQDLGVYQLVNNESLLVEAEDRAYPKMLIALREYDRQIGLFNQKEKNDAVVPFVVRQDRT